MKITSLFRLAGILLCAGLFFPASARAQANETALFAGGCFWSMEKAFDGRYGVINAVSGFSGGQMANPSYERVSQGGTGHHEAVQVAFDPSKVSYEKLLDIYWRNIDPFDSSGQFCDQGQQYISEVFVADNAQKKAAEDSKAAVSAKLGKPVTVQIVPAMPFYPAEDYHQHYALKNPTAYSMYRMACRRDQSLSAIWGKEAHAPEVDLAPSSH